MNLKWGQNLMLKGIHGNVLHEIKNKLEIKLIVNERKWLDKLQ